MNLVELTLLVWLGSLAAGLVGATTGLGGGVIVVPMLTLGFGADIRYAIGASLVSVIATSSGAAAAYVREGYTNLRLGMFLEVATTAGALAGAGLYLVRHGSAVADYAVFSGEPSARTVAGAPTATRPASISSTSTLTWRRLRSPSTKSAWEPAE